MSRSSNLSTIRLSNSKFDLFPLGNRSILVGKFLFFSKVFDQITFKKGLSISHIGISSNLKEVVISLHLFYRTSKILKYKVNLKHLKQNNSILVLNRIKKFRFIDNKIIRLKVFNLNSQICLNSLKSVYLSTKRLTGSLFIRRFNLFLDFTKICSLLIDNKVSSRLFIVYLGYIFRYLPKTKHNKFLFFIKNLFQKMISFKGSKLKGARFEISGRLLGKPRAKTVKILVGQIPIQDLSKIIDYEKIHVFTLYGVFGLKLWLHQIK